MNGWGKGYENQSSRFAKSSQQEQTDAFYGRENVEKTVLICSCFIHKLKQCNTVKQGANF